MAAHAPVRRRPLANANTRIDVLSVVFETSSPVANDSPCDSLSPLNSDFSDSDPKDKTSHHIQDAHNTNAGSHAAHAQAKQEPHFTFPTAQPSRTHAEATPALSTTQACSPRSASLCLPRDHRPAGLQLKKSNGLTTITSTDLRQRILDGHTGTCDSRSQEARPKPKSTRRRPKSPAPPPPQMGNKPSSLNGSPTPAADDKASISSVVHNPARVSRKSSTNLFKRFDSKSPLPRPLTATSIIVTAASGEESLESPVDPFIDPAHAARDSILMLPSPSDNTMTDELASRPLSASTTIKEPRGRKSYTNFDVMTVSEAEERSASVPLNPRGTLSLTLPTPSPLPEDSPHKYGLKDHMDTPEKLLEPPEDLNVQKARRRSSGLEIFNEAKTLQSASSFLNGLSTSRRRAESQNRTTDTWTTGLSTTASGLTSRPQSRLAPSRPQSTRPPSAAHLSAISMTDMHGRRQGKNFKSSGVAYARPLGIVQMKCLQGHTKLHASRNKHAPVECAVCHLDDQGEHFVCAWCALRMCRYCKQDFGERGVAALRERVRKAEMALSPSSSVESFSGVAVNGANGGGRVHS